jgi:hypothetical protein
VKRRQKAAILKGVGSQLIFADGSMAAVASLTNYPLVTAETYGDESRQREANK